MGQVWAGEIDEPKKINANQAFRTASLTATLSVGNIRSESTMQLARFF
jgi:hypothetical protein